MEAFVILVGLVVVLAPIVSVIFAVRNSRRIKRLEGRVALQEAELRQLMDSAAPLSEKPVEIAAPAVPAVVPLEAKPIAPVQSAILPPPVPPPIPPMAVRPPKPPPPAKKHINWEQFMGVKMFAWLGGLALFLAVAFFIKYSFEQGLISPPVRVALGFLTGLGLLVGGLMMSREKYAVTIQTLCSAGILILFADVFASYKFYHFIPQIVAFGLMALVTATAFLLAVRLNAQAVAILGLLGGFLTPVLLGSNEDRPVGLFGYLAILDVGLLAVVLHKRWNYIALLAALATIVMQFGWVEKFFTAAKAPVAMGIFISFAFLFAVLLLWAERRKQAERFLSAAALLLPASAFFFALYLINDSRTFCITRPDLFFAFVFLADLPVLAMAWFRRELRWAAIASGSVVFLLLAVWTISALQTETLNRALVSYLLFAILHSAFPAVAERMRPSGAPAWWARLFGPLALLLVLIPIFKLDAVSMLIWPVVLLVDLVVVVVAIITASVMGLLAAVLLTVIATACWIFQGPSLLGDLPEMLLIIGGFAIFFFAAGLFAAKKFRRTATPSPASTSPWSFQSPEALAAVPATSAFLPFALLALVVVRLPLTNPTPVFGLASLMIILLFGLVRLTKLDLLSAMALLGVAAVQTLWHQHHFDPANPVTPLLWHIGFYSALAIFPFLFQRQLAGRITPWAAAALAAPFHFWLVHRVVNAAWPNSYMGLLPAIFALPALLSLVQLLRSLPADSEKRNALLALYGGVALFFITLIFPIQFSRQWITIGWALEGAALFWLYRRIPHDGLRWAGLALLVTSFVRISPLNVEVFAYQPRSETPIWNWYLYAYGIVTLSLFAAARLTAAPRNKLARDKLNLPAIFWTLGAVLAFLLINIEIADYYSTGPRITFAFSGSFGRDMAYSIAWAAYAFIVMTLGITRRITALRYAGIALLVVTLLKLFLHDISNLGGLYRIGSLIGLALVLIPVSWLYQRFLSAPATTKPKPAEDQPDEK